MRYLPNHPAEPGVAARGEAHRRARHAGAAAVLVCLLAGCADRRQVPVLVPIPDPVRACLPERIHPVSRQYLDAFLLGHISRAQFLRGFPLPNSDYLAVEDCIIAAIDAPAETEVVAPAVRQGSSRL